MSEALRKSLRWHPQEQASESGGAGSGGENKDAGGKSDGDGGDLGTVEDRAARMGWKPADNFRGDKSRWVDAATFVKQGEESLPILRERLKTLERTNVQLAADTKAVREMNDKVYQRALEQARKETKAEIERATEAGDPKAAVAASERLAETERQAAEHKAASRADPEFDNWTSQNAWYQDQELRTEAEVEAFRLRKKGEKSEGTAFLDKVKDAVKARFPEKFGNPRRAAGDGGVERPGGGGESASAGSKKSWDKMPREAKDAGERFIKRKWFKDREAYAKAYWETTQD